ncbi:hypothetical protein HDU98_002826 [Podochytrium sp. JEL0797]|nr:hypothetical protein HDU98_002826 [Podochytrium sp. JEL0797]
MSQEERRDLRLVCGETTFTAHCSILANFSPSFLHHLPTRPVSTLDDPVSIAIPTFLKPATVHLFLRTLYTTPHPQTLPPSTTLSTALQLLSLAVFLDTESIATLTRDSIAQSTPGYLFLDLRDALHEAHAWSMQESRVSVTVTSVLKTVVMSRGVWPLLTGEEQAFLNGEIAMCLESTVPVWDSCMLSNSQLRQQQLQLQQQQKQQQQSGDEKAGRVLAQPLPRIVRHVLADVQFKGVVNWGQVVRDGVTMGVEDEDEDQMMMQVDRGGFEKRRNGDDGTFDLNSKRAMTTVAVAASGEKVGRVFAQPLPRVVRHVLAGVQFKEIVNWGQVVRDGVTMSVEDDDENQIMMQVDRGGFEKRRNLI